MKKKNEKNHIRKRFSILLLCILAILLCTAPCGARDVESGETLNVGTGMDVERIENDYLMVKGGTVNLYPGAYVDYGIYAFDGSAVNIYAGELGANSFITLLDNSTAPTAVVTVYGTGFAVDWDRDGTADPLGPSETEFTPFSNGAVLEGKYKNGYPINLLFFSSVPIYLMETAVSEVEIDIDIKPGGNPNNINLKSNGVVPVAVLTTDGFVDAGNIDPTTVEFAGASPVRWKLCDVDGDGDEDILFHFKTQDLLKSDNNPDGLDVDSTKATLTAKLTDTGTSTMTTGTTGGEVIQGTDTVRILSQKKK